MSSCVVAVARSWEFEYETWFGVKYDNVFILIFRGTKLDTFFGSLTTRVIIAYARVGGGGGECALGQRILMVCTCVQGQSDMQTQYSPRQSVAFCLPRGSALDSTSMAHYHEMPEVSSWNP